MTARGPWLALLSGIFPLVLACSQHDPSDAAGGGSSAAGTTSSPAGNGGQETSGGGAGSSAGGSASGGTAAGGTGGTETTSGGAGSSAGGSASTGGSLSQGGGATDAVEPSMGCNKAPDIALGQFQAGVVAERNTWIRLPENYDPKKAYPVIFIWKGCSAAGITAYGMDSVAGKDAILAQGDFPAGQDCYDTADGAAFVDIPVFDALLEKIETNYCADKAHVFSVGFSSGAWLTQLLACQRGDVLRGIGTIAGAFKPAFMKGAAACPGNGLSAFMVSDLADHNNPFYDEDKDGDSVEIAVNHWLVTNHCTEQMWTMENGTPSTPDTSVCRQYSNCGNNPVKLCLTNGKGHDPQQSLSMPGFWELFQQSLPK